MLENKSILVVGTVRNVGKTITAEITKCLNALSEFKTINFYLVESDSDDNTLKKLEELKGSLTNFSFVSLGFLDEKISNRLDRIRFCRNSYVKYIRTLNKEKTPDYVFVVDLDGMNSALNSQSVLSCFVRNDWDVVVSNQTFGYYDILALRHPTWQKNDWTEEYELEKKKVKGANSKFWLQRVWYDLKIDKVKHRVLYSKMIRINKKNPWIEIQSGFGGAAIYKTEVFKKYDYSKEFETNETDHVSIHRKVLRDGGKILINPKFINSHFNTYNLNRYFIIRKTRNFIWNHNYIYRSKFYGVLKNLSKYR
jgi:hypothetical protein